MRVLNRQIFVPVISVNGRDDVPSYRDMMETYIEFARLHLFAKPVEVRYDLTAQRYFLAKMAERYQDLSALSRELNKKDILLLLQKPVEGSTSLPSSMRMSVLQGSWEHEAIPNFVGQPHFEQEVHELIVKNGYSAACHAFHDFQSLVVWSV